MSGRLRDEALSFESYDTLAAARYLIDRWRLFYNHRRIPRELWETATAAFAVACTAATLRRVAALACAAALPARGR